MTSSRKQAGSPQGGPLYLVIGYLRRPHGLHGEMLMTLHTDFPERIQPGRKVLIGENHEPAEIESVRQHAEGKLIKLRGYETPETAGRLRNQWVSVNVQDVPPLPEGHFYKHEMIGLEVRDEFDRPLGKLDEILETGANDVYIIRDNSGREILLPAIPAVVLELDMKSRKMKVHLLDGLVADREP